MLRKLFRGGCGEDYTVFLPCTISPRNSECGEEKEKNKTRCPLNTFHLVPCSFAIVMEISVGIIIIIIIIKEVVV